ncbi:UNVERIFIED_CONTAM: Complement component C8 beta chain [Gekko kuhli]
MWASKEGDEREEQEKISSKFIHGHSELEVAKYRLKTRDLMLHYEFFQRLLHLPLEYSYGEYRELYRDYGTHYITEATLGGIYDYTLMMNGEELQRAGDLAEEAL